MNKLRFVGCVLLPLVLISGCYGDGRDGRVVVEGDFPVVFAQRDVSTAGNPTDAIQFAPGGDLYMLETASPSARKINLTRTHTRGEGDVSDPEVSYDASRLLFSMRGPDDPTWNIWEYLFDNGELRRVIVDDDVANAGDDVDPHYLPDGRIVFSSNRQEKSRALMVAEGIEPYAFRDEYERERVVVLHVMGHDGTDIRQISFNQSHDRNPTVLMSGEIMYSRWDHVANRNHFPIFFTNPDGTNVFVHYGAFSPGNSFLHPREMEDGRVISSLMPLQGTHQGGALVVIDVQNFSEANHPAPGVDPSGSGQYQPTLYQIPLGREISRQGRFTTPYPLWDGTNRVLAAYTPFQPDSEVNPLTGEVEEIEGPPRYAIYMVNLNKKTQRPLALPPSGKILTDPVAVIPRPLPNIITDKVLNQELANAPNGYGGTGMGVLSVKSVYDTDFLDIMGDSVLVDGEHIPRTGSGDPDLARLRDPAQTTAEERPARFIRVTRAVPTPPGISMPMIGESDFEMQEIVGYAQVEPDGSFRIEVPADMPLGVAVLDAEGRAFQTHTNWLQVRPGETRTCNGCHSPRRAEAPLNEGKLGGGRWENAVDHFIADARESMAETRTRIDPDAMRLALDILYEDVWTDEALANRPPDATRVIDYAGLEPEHAPEAGIINYPDHIQPIWERNRGANTCIVCHNADTPSAGGLDLGNTLSGLGRLNSYDALLIGKPVIDEATGLPRLEVRQNQLVVVREPPLVEVGSANNSSRTSHLIEKLYEQQMRSSHTLRGPGFDPELGVERVDHSGMLNASELRLLAEWIDVGAQYYNDPWDGDDRTLANVRGRVHGLDEDDFVSRIHPQLLTDCASCHQAFGNTGGLPDFGNVNQDFTPNRFVLTGNAEGDFNITAGMVNNVCQPELSNLLVRPTSTMLDPLPHPGIPVLDGSGGPVLDEDGNPVVDPLLGSDDHLYHLLLDWIVAAAAANNCP
ncbi:MAG: hypothetical protein JJU06_10070 [Ectothiorhodospiraceae bacterium]|nr:hypothetical protein [Ectothiorhodospiraceae bacterium]